MTGSADRDTGPAMDARTGDDPPAARAAPTTCGDGPVGNDAAEALAQRRRAVDASEEHDPWTGVGPEATGDRPPASDTTAAIDRLVRRVLLIGLSLSAGLLVVGFIVWVAADADVPHDVLGPAAALRAIGRGEPLGFFSWGLLALILTPFVRVAGTVVIFLHQHDWRFAAVTAFVLLSMSAGILAGAL